jgi:hypothetical protein
VARARLTGGVYRDDAPGLEVRVGYGENDLLRSQRTADLSVARSVATTWRAAVLAKGGFTGLEPGVNDAAPIGGFDEPASESPSPRHAKRRKAMAFQ